jgi:predicted outer membrane repeat protein
MNLEISSQVTKENKATVHKHQDGHFIRNQDTGQGGGIAGKGQDDIQVVDEYEFLDQLQIKADGIGQEITKGAYQGLISL